MNNPIHEFSAALDELISLVDNFNQEEFNTVPFAGSWTGARVAQHLYLAMKGMPEVLKAEGEITERDPNEMESRLKSIFLNLDTKFNSPDFIFPEDKTYEQAALYEQLSAIKTAVIAATNGLDLNLLTHFQLPGMPPLTRSEAIWFAAYHTERHNQQLKNILGKLRS